MTDDWFRSKGWNPEEFERRLQRARPFNRPQYMKIQAITFLETGKPELRPPAIELLTRLYDDQSEDAAFERPVAPEYLADAYAADRQFERAVLLYLEAIERQRTSNHRGNPRLKLAGLVLRDHLDAYYQRAYEALTDPTWDTRGLFDSQRFESARDAAFLGSLVGDRETAREWAVHALSLAATRTNPEFARHPSIGLIKTDPETLGALERLAGNAV